MPTRAPLRPTVWWTAALCLSLAACGKEAAPRQAAPAPVVTATEVRMRAFNDRLQALGTVAARESVMLTAKISDTVQRVHFDSGDEVPAGQVLVTLGGRQQAAALQAAQATVVEADRLYERQQQLAAQQLIASSSLDTQRATRDAARARVTQLAADVGDRTIRAPFAGVLGIRRVSPGALVQPGTEVASLDDLSSVYVDFQVPETQLALVAKGQVLEGRSAAYAGRTFEGTVDVVEARVDPASRAVMVRGVFPNADRVLRPGMLLQIDLQRAERQAMMIPEISVVQVGRDTFVFRLKADDSVEQAPVRIGARASGQAEILEGLAAGERIVVDGTGKLRAGQKVQLGSAAQARAGTPAAASPGDTGGAETTAPGPGQPPAADDAATQPPQGDAPAAAPAPDTR